MILYLHLIYALFYLLNYTLILSELNVVYIKIYSHSFTHAHVNCLYYKLLRIDTTKTHQYLDLNGAAKWQFVDIFMKLYSLFILQTEYYSVPRKKNLLNLRCCNNFISRWQKGVMNLNLKWRRYVPVYLHFLFFYSVQLIQNYYLWLKKYTMNNIINRGKSNKNICVDIWNCGVVNILLIASRGNVYVDGCA